MHAGICTSTGLEMLQNLYLRSSTSVVHVPCVFHYLFFWFPHVIRFGAHFVVHEVCVSGAMLCNTDLNINFAVAIV